MKKSLTAFSIFFTLTAFAQTSGSIQAQPKIAELMEAYKNYNRKNDLVDGYRLQIAFSNDRQEVYGDKAKLYKEFPNEHFYVTYEQPSYKLRLGDFTTRMAAFQKLQEVLPKYPGAFIVKDWVKTH
ncbi:MAG: SPOR domain-containing protein [Chitinophagales bacterium]